MSDQKNTAVERAGEEIANAIATGLKWLGTGDASTHFGAIEAHAVMTKEAEEVIAEAISEAGDRIAEALVAVAHAIRNHS